MSASFATISCRMADGRPLSTLSHLLVRRAKLLNESAKDAVVATTIMVLQSLRKETRKYRGKGVRIGRN